MVQPGEVLRISLLATDQLNNRREAIYDIKGPAGQTVSVSGDQMCGTLHKFSY